MSTLSALRDSRGRALSILDTIVVERLEKEYRAIYRRRPMQPLTTIEIASIGGTFSQQEYRIAWIIYPEHRGVLDAAAAELAEGWTA